MVDYSTWVGIVFNIAESKGFDASFDENQSVIAVAAEIWNDKKARVKGMTESEARDLADREVSVK